MTEPFHTLSIHHCVVFQYYSLPYLLRFSRTQPDSPLYTYSTDSSLDLMSTILSDSIKSVQSTLAAARLG